MAQKPIKKTSTVRLNREIGELENKPKVRPQKGPTDMEMHDGHISFENLSTDSKIIQAEKDGYINRELSLILQDIVEHLKSV
jgi:hypothetical protein